MSASPNEAVELELSTHCSVLQPIVTSRKEPKMVCFLPKRLCLKRAQVYNVSVGLENMWNTCYMNSVLQCLTHTPPLTNYMLTKNHSKTCLQQQSCTMCTMEEHITEVLASSGKTVWPFGVLNELTNIGKHFRYGMQEDAYEFLHCLIGAMQQDCIVTQINGPFEENTIIDQVFVGHLRSSVMCLTCYAVTDTIEPFVDFSLEIEAVYNIKDALASFMKLKLLDRQTALQCKNCKNKYEAIKTLSIHRSPNVLTVHLKRFSVLTGKKIEKYVSYPEHLDLRPFMSADDGMGRFYKLYAVLVHSGSSLQDGHHFCFVKASHGKWLKMDDSSVTVMDIRTVLSQQAYVLFYIRSDDARTPQGSHNSQMPAGPVDAHDYATICQCVGTTGHRPPPAVTETPPMNYSSETSVAPPPANRRSSEQNLTKNYTQNSASSWPRLLAASEIYSDHHHYTWDQWDQSSYRDRSPHDGLPSHRELHHCQRQTPSQPRDSDQDRSSHHYDRDPRTIEISWHERSGSSHHHQKDSHDRRMESTGSQKRERSPETDEDCVKRLKTMSDRHP